MSKQQATSPHGLSVAALALDGWRMSSKRSPSFVDPFRKRERPTW
jgi:hypothetical protein